MRTDRVERWGCFELSLPGKQDGNPFTDYTIHGRFRGEHETVSADGFYDGEGIYRIRFMPSFPGVYHYEIDGTFGMPQSGMIEVAEASEGNHGPVRVADTYYFSYADGTPFYPLGTTCYVWELQPDELIRKTLESLKKARFNKIRFCILPKHYDYNLGEPRSYPFEGTPMDSSVLTKDNFSRFTGKTEGNHFDLSRLNPAHFRHIEHCILELQKLGIEADLIVMHPYDRWGFSSMPREADELYWKYVIARFSAYRNVWWAAANEYDLLRDKKEEDWEFYGQLMTEHDPYHHLRSIHNCFAFYDHTRPWITHCSILISGAISFISRWCWMRSPMRETFSTAGGILPAKSLCAGSGKERCEAAIRDTGRHSFIRREFSGGAMAGSCTGKAGNASVFCWMC